MGTDINVYIEHKDKKSGRWEPLQLFKKIVPQVGEAVIEDATPYFGRDYAGFDRVKDIMYLRGMPDDVSDYVVSKFCEGCYDVTWFDYVELGLRLKLDQFDVIDDNAILYDEEYNAVDEDGNELKPSQYPKRHSMMTDIYDWMKMVVDVYGLYPEPNEVRVVLWFDC